MPEGKEGGAPPSEKEINKEEERTKILDRINSLPDTIKEKRYKMKGVEGRIDIEDEKARNYDEDWSKYSFEDMIRLQDTEERKKLEEESFKAAVEFRKSANYMEVLNELGIELPITGELGVDKDEILKGLKEVIDEVRQIQEKLKELDKKVDEKDKIQAGLKPESEEYKDLNAELSGLYIDYMPIKSAWWNAIGKTDVYRDLLKLVN